MYEIIIVNSFGREFPLKAFINLFPFRRRDVISSNKFYLRRTIKELRKMDGRVSIKYKIRPVPEENYDAL